MNIESPQPPQPARPMLPLSRGLTWYVVLFDADMGLEGKGTNKWTFWILLPAETDDACISIMNERFDTPLIHAAFRLSQNECFKPIRGLEWPGSVEMARAMMGHKS